MTSDPVLASREAAEEAKRDAERSRAVADAAEQRALVIALEAGERERQEREAAAELERRVRLRLQAHDDAIRGLQMFAGLDDLPRYLAAIETGPDDPLYAIALQRGVFFSRLLDAFDNIPLALTDLTDPNPAK